MKVGPYNLNRIYKGDALKLTRRLPDESVHCIVTSPPYWGLRNYGEKGEWGREPTPDGYIHTMVEFFREARRVLRADGTLWLNLGDSYAGSTGHFGYPGAKTVGRTKYVKGAFGKRPGMSVLRACGYKDKDLLGIPWRVVFALQGFSVVAGGMVSAAAEILKGARAANDWALAASVELMLAAWSQASLATAAYWHRTDVVWWKPNATPERVPDRPTRGHEFVFLLTRSARYFFDVHGILEKAVGKDDRRRSTRTPGMRRMRTVWPIMKSRYPGSHVAPFPMKLVEPCIRAGTSEKGCCPACGAPWARQKDGRTWRPGCACGGRRGPVPCIVLDPFAGSGTTGVVALRLGRAFLGFDLAGGGVDQGGWTPQDRLRAAAAGQPEPWRK